MPARPRPTELNALRLDTAQALLSQAGLWRQQHAQRNLAGTQAVIDGLCELSLRDPLTGLANRRQFLMTVERELDRVARSGEAALLLMLDIDFFKSVNDTHGHVVGDQVLKAIARMLSTCVRPMDTLARYGGEEFAVVLPNCQAAFGATVAERIRHLIATTPVPIGPHLQLPITVSIGGAYALQWIRSTAELWIERADHQLYLAKSNGRNRVHLEAQPDSTVSAEEKDLLFLPMPNGGLSEDSLESAAWR